MLVVTCLLVSNILAIVGSQSRKTKVGRAMGRLSNFLFCHLLKCSCFSQAPQQYYEPWYSSPSSLEAKDWQIWYSLFATRSIFTYILGIKILMWSLLMAIVEGCTQLWEVPFTLISLWMALFRVVQSLTFISCKRLPCIGFSFQLFFSCLTSMLYNWVNSNYLYYPDRLWYDSFFLWSLSFHCKCRLFIVCSFDKVLPPLMLFSDITSAVKLFLSHHFPAPHRRHS